MQVVSLAFLAFLAIISVVNIIIPRKCRYILLFLASMGFYISIDIKGMFVLSLSILSTYLSGIIIEKTALLSKDRSVSSNEKKEAAGRNIVFIACIVVNVCLLLFFKYYGFFSRNINSLLGTDRVPMLSIVAPIGISFYILKALSYLIDVKRGTLKAEKNLIKYALYVSFFTQIVSGPIDRAGNLISQFNFPVTVDFDRFRDGFLQILWGYFMKLVLADRMAIFVSAVYSDVKPGTITFIGTLLYTFEIYCDFGGYSHIVIGASRLLGIDVKNNFESPYLAASISEFWRRWHISLSSWLKDYIYIPLGGNRKGTFRKHLNILIVFAVSGLWHGANWTFIIWGLMHGVYQILGYIFKPLRDRAVRVFKVDRNQLSHRCFKIAVTFSLVNFAWIFFRAESVSQAVEIAKRSFEFTPWVLTNGDLYKQGLDSANLLLVLWGLILVICVDIANYKGYIIREKIMGLSLWFRWAIMIAAIMVTVICGIWGPGYDAASFIYQQF
ncbi:MBOAT family O-acyltransferase [Butyrivibrio sp. YAB3001]|uniref:MBOAT family O-acyltransferase n=1 Tax=Butyrivibrio sp. YAB3001 TaxID=1520812 RepID=UPI0008F6308C|nr:MBOAT family O-acyltransferase [Butyrivibrio sp. YAB3001]SFC77500.1 D-alanyl-lipoteichoic acid acyltransferase DltB, MBOAT superfamily [Butyrivibrio sp. YAB3001]